MALHTYLELILTDVLLHFMQLLHSIAASLLYGFTVFRNCIEMTLHHTLHAGKTAMLTAVQALSTVFVHNVNSIARLSCRALQIIGMVNQMP